MLGYPFLEIKEVNAGSVPEGEYDMVNYIHEWPDHSGRVLVITEGLTDDSIFRRFMMKYGQGIHHLALQVDDLDVAWEELKKSGVKLTSGHIMFDFLSGLKQLFIDNTDTGVFIELIERSKSGAHPVNAAEKGFFTHDNMAGLAGTMNQYLTDVAGTGATKNSDTDTLPAERIAGLKLREFVLEVEHPDKAAAFFSGTFGFVRAEAEHPGDVALFLETEPDLRFICRQKGAGLMRHSLNCEAGLQAAQLRDLLLNPHIKAAAQGRQLSIAPLLTGYPMNLVCA